MKKLIFPLIILLMLLGYVTFYFSRLTPVILFTTVSIYSSALFVLLAYFIQRSDISSHHIFILISAGIIFRLLLFPIGPIASDDVYRYLWDGKVQVNGVNPYTYSADDPELKHLSSEIIPSKVNFPHLKSIYPPYSQWMFLIAYLISGESTFGLKLLLLLSDIITLVLIMASLKNFNLPQKNVLLYALCPLPIMQFFIDSHVDGFGITLLVLFIYFVSKKEKLYSYFVLGLSIASKLITGMIYPFLLKEKNPKNFIAVIFVPIITVMLIYLPYSINGFPFESLLLFTQKWASNGSVYLIFYEILNDSQAARIISMGLFFITYIYLYFSTKELMEKVYLIFIFFFLFSPVVHPWYITWISLLVCFSFRWSGIVFAALISIANIYAVNYLTMGQWKIDNLLLVIQYLPVFVILIYELLKDKLKAKLIST